MPSWIRHVAAGNPVGWALDAARAALADDPGWGTAAAHGGWLLLLTAATVSLAVHSFRSYQKSR